MDNRPICYVLTGPTASGKTALSLRVAEAFNCEIISMDSMQIYRGMDIGTAKPTPEEKAACPHHMVDIVDPRDAFSVAQYQEMAESCARDIIKRGKTPLFVGGTGFYLRALRSPMAMGVVTGDAAIRARLEAEAAVDGGKEKLHARLSLVDPVTAKRLHVNDVRRVVRALEVYELTGEPFSQQKQPEGEAAFRYRVATLEMDRALLYSRIEKRVDIMMAEGLLAEVQRLLDEGVPPAAQSMKAIGYKELIAHLQGEYDLETAIYELKKNTRHYAKRQLTWMRGEADVTWIDPTGEDAWEKLQRCFKGE